MKNSTHLYADKDLNTNLTVDAVIRSKDSKGVTYFYDGNNGDKHMLVGYTMDYSGKKAKIDTVLGVNLTQCHVASESKERAFGSFGGSYKNAQQLTDGLVVPTTGKELQNLFNNVMVHSF